MPHFKSTILQRVPQQENTILLQAKSGAPPPVHIPMSVTHAMHQHIERALMPEGDCALPEAGLIFFEYLGKDKAIR
jgi:hypothetical protein